MTIEPEALLRALDLSLTDPDVERLKKALGDVEIADFEGNLDYQFFGKGLALLFEDDVLTGIQLFPDGRDGYTEYADPIPHQIHFSMRQADVRALLGAPSETIEDDEEDADVYKFADHVLNISYDKKKGTITLLTFMSLKKFANFDH